MNGKVSPQAMVDIPTRAARSWGHTARFFTTAARLEQLPTMDAGAAGRLTGLHEVAFVGRSNAGKSTAINTLAQQKRLAFASKTPGRTQQINLFALGPKDAPNALWADLPGYGYAAVDRAAKRRWQQVMADYLVMRQSLAGVVLLVDSRLGLTELDLQLVQWIGPRVRSGEVKLLCLLTKADKLSRTQAARSLQAAQEALARALDDVVAGIEADVGANAESDDLCDVSVSLFSALSREGVDDVLQLLHRWALASSPAAP